MPICELTTGPVSYSDDGTGPVIVLLHATLHDRSDYASVIEALAPTNRVIALDWPGHGESLSPAAPLREGAVLFGEVFEEFVHRLDLTDMVIVGNSVGGYAACNMAITHPELVAGLVIAQGSGFVPPSAIVKAFYWLHGRPWVIRRAFPFEVPRYMAAQSDRDKTIVKNVLARSQTPHGSQVAANLWASFGDPRHDLRDRAGAITAPTLITWGTRDKNLKVDWGKAIHRAIPHSVWTEMQTGHVPFASAPQDWLRIVRPFIAAAHTRKLRSVHDNTDATGE